MAKKALKHGTGRHVGPRWTVMVFMGADGVEGNKPLAAEADDDIAEMEKVGTSESLRIFVQRHGDGVARRFHVGGRDYKIPRGDEVLTNGWALAKFMEWALEDHRPDDYSMLVLWGHAYRFGIGHTETRAGIDAIDFAELAEVLKRLQDKRARSGDRTPKLDIVAFDACDLATIEMTVQLQQYADYLLASQIGIPLPGWPYDRILARIKEPFGREFVSPAEFGAYVVRRYCEFYHAEDRTVSLTLLDLNRAQEVSAHTEVLALRLAETAARDRSELRSIQSLFRMSYTGEGKPFVDVPDLCLNLIRGCSDPYVIDAARALGDFLLSPPPGAPAHNGLVGAKRPFIAEHGRNTALTAKLNGISLYAPHVANNHDWEGASYWYKKFAFVQRTLWSDLVQAFANDNH